MGGQWLLCQTSTQVALDCFELSKSLVLTKSLPTEVRLISVAIFIRSLMYGTNISLARIFFFQKRNEGCAV